LNSFVLALAILLEFELSLVPKVCNADKAELYAEIINYPDTFFTDIKNIAKNEPLTPLFPVFLRKSLYVDVLGF
jgi:hypothetical protein